MWFVERGEKPISDRVDLFRRDPSACGANATPSFVMSLRRTHLPSAWGSIIDVLGLGDLWALWDCSPSLSRLRALLASDFDVRAAGAAATSLT